MPVDSKYSGIKSTKENPLDAKESPQEQVEEKGRVKRQAKTQATVATKQKQGLVGRFVKAWVGPRGFVSIKNYISKEVVIPAIKDMIADAGKSAIDIALNQDRSRRYPSNTTYPGRYTNTVQKANQYKNAYKKYNQASTASYNGAPSEPNFDVKDAVIGSREVAVEILDDLIEIIDQYGHVSVADYYDFVGFDPEVTDNAYGWTDLSAARVINLYGSRGYTIAFPPADVV